MQCNEDVSHMLDEELGQAVWISQTFLQLSQKVAAVGEGDGGPVAAAHVRRWDVSETNQNGCVSCKSDRKELDQERRQL